MIESERWWFKCYSINSAGVHCWNRLAEISGNGLLFPETLLDSGPVKSSA
jgi:hypothetical protein